MKVKIDENLGTAHKLLLQEAGHDVEDVYDEKVAGASDEELWRLVCREGRFLVTLDVDFSDVRLYPPASHPGILLIRTGHPSMSSVASILQRVLGDPGGLERLSGCLAVADETRTRVRRSA